MKILVSNGGHGGRVFEILDDNLWVSLVDPHTNRDVYIGSLFFEQDDRQISVTWGTNDNDDEWWVETNPIVIDRPKMPILVHSWHTPGGTGGFDWMPDTPRNLAILNAGFLQDQEDFEHSVLVRFSIQTNPSLTDAARREDVTDYIDAVLLDLIETRQLGRILASHDRDGIHPRISAGLTLEGQP